MGRPDRANPDTENDACRRPSQSQAPAMRRPARTAKPQERIPEHEASFQTRGPNRSRRRREQERRISRPSQKSPGVPEWARLNAPFPAFGGGVGVRWPSGQRGRPLGARRGRRSRLRHGAFSAPFRLSVRQGGARALAPRLRQKQRTRRSSCVPDARIDRIRQDDRHVLVGVSADHLERSDRGVQIVPPMLLQFAVGVKRLRIRIKSARRLRKVSLAQGDRRHATMARLRWRRRAPRRRGRRRRSRPS